MAKKNGLEVRMLLFFWLFLSLTNDQSSEPRGRDCTVERGDGKGGRNSDRTSAWSMLSSPALMYNGLEKGHPSAPSSRRYAAAHARKALRGASHVKQVDGCF